MPGCCLMLKLNGKCVLVIIYVDKLFNLNRHACAACAVKNELWLDIYDLCIPNILNASLIPFFKRYASLLAHCMNSYKPLSNSQSWCRKICYWYEKKIGKISLHAKFASNIIKKWHLFTCTSADAGFIICILVSVWVFSLLLSSLNIFGWCVFKNWIAILLQALKNCQCKFLMYSLVHFVVLFLW